MKCCPAVLQANLTHENWVGVLQQVDIPGGGRADAFLPQAVSLANDRCWGTLSCTVIVDPKTQSSSALAVDKAIADLRYGSVNVNLPTILGYAVMKMAWGGFPGATPQVHETCLLCKMYVRRHTVFASSACIDRLRLINQVPLKPMLPQC